MQRIDMGKRCTIRPEHIEGMFIGKLRNMLVYIEGDVGEDVIIVKAYLNKPLRDNKYQPIADLILCKEYYKNAYHVDLMRIDNRYQGHGIAPKFYRYVMKKLGIVIQAGRMQSAGGRQIWSKLCDMKDVVMFGRKGRRLYQLEVDDETGELVTLEGVKVYDGPYKFDTFACYQG